MHLSLRLPRLGAPHLPRLVVFGLLGGSAEQVCSTDRVLVQVGAVFGGHLVDLLYGTACLSASLALWNDCGMYVPAVVGIGLGNVLRGLVGLVGVLRVDHGAVVAERDTDGLFARISSVCLSCFSMLVHPWAVVAWKRTWLSTKPSYCTQLAGSLWPAQQWDLPCESTCWSS